MVIGNFDLWEEHIRRREMAEKYNEISRDHTMFEEAEAAARDPHKRGGVGCPFCKRFLVWKNNSDRTWICPNGGCKGIEYTEEQFEAFLIRRKEDDKTLKKQQKELRKMGIYATPRCGFDRDHLVKDDLLEGNYRCVRCGAVYEKEVINEQYDRIGVDIEQSIKDSKFPLQQRYKFNLF